MKRRRASAQAIALSPSQLMAKFSLVLLIGASVSLMVISKTQPDIRGRIATPIIDAISPALDVLSRPVEALGDARTWFGKIAGVYAQNESLRADNAVLMQWQSVALQLEAENMALRNLLNYRSQDSLSFTTAKVVGDKAGPFTHSVVVNAGNSAGVKVGEPVVNQEGFVGQVIESGAHSSRILLLTDVSSRIPVVGEQTRERSIAAGNNGQYLNLMYLPENSQLKVGERLVTSGDGETVPAGLAVGEVVNIKGREVTVRPYTNWYRLEYISIVDHKEEAVTQ